MPEALGLRGEARRARSEHLRDGGRVALAAPEVHLDDRVVVPIDRGLLDAWRAAPAEAFQAFEGRPGTALETERVAGATGAGHASEWVACPGALPRAHALKAV